MISVWQLFQGMGLVGVLILAAVFLGGWLVFRSKAGPGEGVVRTPKGDVYRIPDADVAEEFPEAPETILERTEKFLETWGGKK